MLVQLGGEPRVQLPHDRAAVPLVKREPVHRREVLRTRLRVVAIDVAYALEDMPALGRETRRDVDHVASRMRQAVPEDHRQRLRQVAAQRIAHLDWRAEIRRARGQYVGEILAGMPTTGQKERDA